MKKAVFLLAMLLSFQIGVAQKKNMTDSIVALSDVEIVATPKQKINLIGLDVPLNYLPITVTKLNSVTLERKNIVNLEDAVRFLPGVTVTDQLGAFQRYSVRGSSDAVIAVNGVRDERSLLNNVPFDDLSSVECIEVIKGAASVLSGHSVMGGVINIIQKRPTDEFSANAKLSYGSWNVKQSTIGFGRKLYGPVNYRAHVFYATGDGYRDVGAERFSGLFTLGSEIGKDGYLEGNVSFNKDDFRTEIGSAPLMPGNIFSVSNDQKFASANDFNPLANYRTTYGDNANNQMRVRNIDLSLKYTHNLTDWLNLREQFNYNHRDLDYSAVENMKYRTSTDPIYDWYYMNPKGVKTYIELDSLQSGSPLCFNPDSKSFSNTLEFTGKYDFGTINNSYAIGWSYSFFDYTQYNGYNKGDVWGPGVNQMLPVVDPHTNRDWWDSKVSAASIRRYETNGLYFHDVLDLNEQWKIMVGGRLDLFNYRTATATIDDGRQHYYNENRTPWKKVKTSSLSYRAGAVYLPIPSLTLYASGASFFKPNITTYNKNVIYIDKNGHRFDPDANGGEVFRPEKGHQAEVGFRYELNNMLEVNASVFYINRYNTVKGIGKMSETEDEGVVEKNVMAQIGRAATKGFDMDITFRPLPTLQFTGGWGWSDYRVLKSKGIDLSDWPDFSENTNLRLTGSPRTTFFIYGDYTIPKGVLKDLSFHLSGTYTDRIYRNMVEKTYYPSYFLVDAGVYYTIKKQVKLSLVVNNIFDKEYFVKPTTIGKPANIMTSISYTFK